MNTGSQKVTVLITVFVIGGLTTGLTALPVFGSARDHDRLAQRPAHAPDQNGQPQQFAVASWVRQDLVLPIKRHWYPPKVNGFLDPLNLNFTVLRNGKISNMRITHSSGISLVDSATVEAIRQAEPFQHIPASFGRHANISLTLFKSRQLDGEWDPVVTSAKGKQLWPESPSTSSDSE